MPQETILKMDGINKTFGVVPVLKNVELSVYKGEVLALMGENGAGKSTLMKILCGIHQATSGTILINDEIVPISDIADAMNLGFVLIHQELNLLDNLDVAGNLFLGREPVNKFRLVDRNKLYQDAEKVLAMVGLDIVPTIMISELSLAQQQLIEIAKALSQQAKILIMDEPTSSLTLKETEKLFETIRDLKAKGVTIIYISHRLNEIMEIADRAVVLKDGRNSGILFKDEITHNNLVRLMVGRDIEKPNRTYNKKDDSSLKFTVNALRTERYPQHELTFDIHPGEILGISGLIGSGRTELAESIFGIRKIQSGSFSLGQQALKITSVRDAIESGIFLIPEDRKKHGIFTDLNLIENISLPDLKNYASFGFIDQDKEKGSAEKQMKMLNIKAASASSNLSNLSGGNQQKVAIGKWLNQTPALIIFDEPTRGVDVGAKNEIYEIMRSLSANGVMILVISSDLEEIINISDRLLVMHEGQITGELFPSDFTEEKIMLHAVGHA